MAEARVWSVEVEDGDPADTDGDATGTPLPQKLRNARIAAQEYRQWAREATDPHDRAFCERQAREEERRVAHLARLARDSGRPIARPRPVRQRGHARQPGRRARRTRTVAKSETSSGDDGPAPPSPGAAVVGRPFHNFLVLHEGLSGPELLAKFGAQPPAVQSVCWAALREAIERRRP